MACLNFLLPELIGSLKQKSSKITFQVEFNPYFSPEINVSRILEGVFVQLVVNCGIKWWFFLLFCFVNPILKPALHASGQSVLKSLWVTA